MAGGPEKQFCGERNRPMEAVRTLTRAALVRRVRHDQTRLKSLKRAAVGLSPAAGFTKVPVMKTPVIALLTCATLLLAGCATNTPAPTPPSAPSAKLDPLDEGRLAEALLLKNEHRYLEAAAIYEELSKTHPKDSDLVARQAALYSQQADAETDPVKAKSLNQRARVLAEKAEKLGTTNPMPPLILASIKPDGSRVELAKGAFSKREEVEQLIREGEAAFGRNDFNKAGECYQKAFELEPTNYKAALFAGDAYFSSKQFEPACEWFRKAIAISPDNETAHRYLGDALARLGRREEAFDEKIAALLCEPYLRTTRQHFTAEMRAAAEARGYTIPRFPAMRSSIEGKQINLAVDPGDGALIVAYNVCAVGWRSKDFAEHYPKEKVPRRSLPEEIFAIDALLAAAVVPEKEASTESDKALLKKWQPIIDGLTALKRAGLLEAYAFFERADEGLAKDYAAYRAEHRDKLERYIRRYWCGVE